MRNWLVAIVLVVLVAGSLGVGYFIGTSSERTVTSVSTTTLLGTYTTTTATLTSTYPNLGTLLQLRVELNASTIRQGDAIMAGITLTNSLAVNLSAIPSSLSNSTLATWRGYDFVCAGSWGEGVTYALGYALFQGHYTANNLSSAGKPLTLTPPIYPPCAVSLPPHLYLFLPNGSDAWAYFIQTSSPTLVQMALNATTETCATNSMGGTECPVGNALYGYWNTTGALANLTPSNATSFSKYFHYFSPGSYTLVVEATWGQESIEYFEVSP